MAVAGLGPYFRVTANIFRISFTFKENQCSSALLRGLSARTSQAKALSMLDPYDMLLVLKPRGGRLAMHSSDQPKGKIVIIAS
jgi:hypothetical protein